MNEKLKAFLQEYEELCRKHSLVIRTCGCCDSPWVDELKDESDSMDRKQLDEVHKAIETASDTVDEIDDAE